MEFRRFLWSATSCDHPGAGLYFGLSLPSEHLSLARYLTSKQVRVYTGVTVKIRPEWVPCPINYFAIRDPSAVKVRTLDKPKVREGFRFVTLSFSFEGVQPSPASDQAAAELEAHASRCGLGPSERATAAFLLTIGLPIEREERLFQTAILSHPAQGWSDLAQRLLELGRNAPTEGP